MILPYTGECPLAISWGSKAYLDSTSHAELECAGVGLCDFDSGTCVCPEGFSGQACERLKCPNDCNGKGSCMTLSDIAKNYGQNIAYTNWDGISSTMCVCDSGYSGPDCSDCK